ncbi:sugar ABC transporter ATP-binding protein (plasmid) [Rhizobium gallicum bv. gallicum R602sp]|uniref:Sugar ABC transporter ATP-binding protein n=1 Tax=Rhizobium gallicum bv. gallicum R602sp TaxID=1041138 RepID=A0A0B4XCF6_9HYPH|nr:sugar ABC transporter ATP-binding protein [Rhizobium gallicum]AJD44197.1 sugar ABC transporter ATP-binding protein [Rhizobium gallicum bv. gallicum R602sp]TDW28099.1 monosaccharide ABC transporter ATP-binding protein (CUT2 family) [Rhizobium azibense]
MPLLDIQSLSLSFGSTLALADASLSLQAGEIVALMGANGAGKSTLVKVLSGVHRADSGIIFWKGALFQPNSPAEAARSGVVTVHQSTDVVGIPDLTVADALLLDRYVDGREPFFLSAASVRRAAARILDEVGITLPLERRFGDLGTADRQLVAIARALSNKAELLILDEPTASLSSNESQRLYTFLRVLKSRGIAILYISHRTTDLMSLADHVVVLRGGRDVGTFTRPIDFGAAIETMIGRPLKSARPDRRALSGRPVLELKQAVLLPGSRPFDFTVHEGEVVAITGVLGAGKSRLLSAIFGRGALAAGSMRLDGRAYHPAGPAEAIAAGVVMAAEDRHRSSLIPAGWPGESLAATISLPHLKRWYPSGFLYSGRETREAVAAIRRLGIKAQGPRASIWSLSGGNQQKAVLARWEAEPSRLLLLDEPFQGVDVGARQDIIHILRDHRDRATLIATSDPEEAYEVADRMVHISNHSLFEGADDAMYAPEGQLTA